MTLDGRDAGLKRRLKLRRHIPRTRGFIPLLLHQLHVLLLGVLHIHRRRWHGHAVRHDGRRGCCRRLLHGGHLGDLDGLRRVEFVGGGGGGRRVVGLLGEQVLVVGDGSDGRLVGSIGSEVFGGGAVHGSGRVGAVLVFGEGGFAAETSLAHGFLADIRPTAGVDSAMARQTRGIGEGLVTTLMVADMGLFAGVCPRMHGQGAPLDEALVAVLEHAVIRTFVGVYSIVSAEVGLAVEGFSAILPGAVEITSASWRHDGGRRETGMFEISHQIQPPDQTNRTGNE